MVNKTDLKILGSTALFSSFARLLIYLNFLLRFSFTCVNEITVSQKRRNWLVWISISYLTAYFYSNKWYATSILNLILTDVIRFWDCTTHCFCPDKCSICGTRVVSVDCSFPDLIKISATFIQLYWAFDQTAWLSAQSTAEFVTGALGYLSSI